MKTISVINLKGGVAKTLTAGSMAHILATIHGKRVLLIDNDKQGNTSKTFGVHSYDDKSISDVLTARRLDPWPQLDKAGQVFTAFRGIVESGSRERESAWIYYKGIRAALTNRGATDRKRDCEVGSWEFRFQVH